MQPFRFLKKLSLSKPALVGIVFTLLISANSYAGGILILINGASCSGKSTLAKELVRQLNDSDENPYGGDCWQMESVDQYVVELTNLSDERLCEMDKNPNLVHVSEVAKSFDPFHSRIRKKLMEGRNLVVDHCFMNDGVFKNALFNFRGQRVLFVKLYVDYETAHERLEIRNQGGNRSEYRTEGNLSLHYNRGSLPTFRLDAYQQQTGEEFTCMGLPTHLDKFYDLEIKSTKEVNALEIISGWLNSKSISETSFFLRHITLWDKQHKPIEANLESNCFISRERTSFSDDYMRKK